MVLAPVVKDRKGEHAQAFGDARKAGFVRVRVDGEVRALDDPITLAKTKRHSIDVVVDRVIVPPARDDERNALSGRLADSVEQALRLGGGIMLIAVEGEESDRVFSEELACPDDLVSFGEIEPRIFSFNSPHGACPACTGLGVRMEVDPELVIPDRQRSLAEGAIEPWARGATSRTWYQRLLEAAADALGFDAHTPIARLPEAAVDALLYGLEEPLTIVYRTQRGRSRTYDARYEGVVTNLARRYAETDSEWMRGEIERYMAPVACPECGGQRLKPEALAVKIDGLHIVDVTRMDIAATQRWADRLASRRSPLNARERTIAAQILKEIRARLTFLVDVGLEYLTLDRAAGSLSGGEAQRIRLATQIGSSLMGVLYVCDEPSIGLHPLDDARLIRTLERLRDLGNTILIVEHDEATMLAADHIIDMGPGAGEAGRTGRRAGHARRGDARPALHHRRLSGRPEADPAARPAPAGQRPPHYAARRRRAQPARDRRRVPSRRLYLRHRRERLRQEHPGGRDPLPQGRPAVASGQTAARPGGRRGGLAAHRQGHRHRPVPHRPHAALQSRHLHRRLHADPGTLRLGAGGTHARLQARPVLLQRQGGPLRGLSGGGLQHD